MAGSLLMVANTHLSVAHPSSTLHQPSDEERAHHRVIGDTPSVRPNMTRVQSSPPPPPRSPEQKHDQRDTDSENEASENEIEKMIDGLGRIELGKDALVVVDVKAASTVRAQGEEDASSPPARPITLDDNIVCSEDENSRGSAGSDAEDENEKKDEEKREDDDSDASDEDLIERGPARSRQQFANRPRPYTADFDVHRRASLPATYYDSGAKAILTDRAYREKIDLCLDKLSSSSGSALGGHRQSFSGSSSSSSGADSYAHFADADFFGRRSPSCEQQQQQQQQLLLQQHCRADRPSEQFDPTFFQSQSSPAASSSASSAYDAETSLLDILSRGGFQAAATTANQQLPAVLTATSDYGSGGSVASTSSRACASDNWPDSPGGGSSISSVLSGNAYGCAASTSSRCESRGSSYTSGYSGGGGGGGAVQGAFVSPVGSPLDSSPHNLQNYQASSSLSSDESYCETPSPVNPYASVDQSSDDRASLSLSPWNDSFDQSYAAADSSSSEREFHLQLVDELIRSDMGSERQKPQITDDSCSVTSSCDNASIHSISKNSHRWRGKQLYENESSQEASEVDTVETLDDLTSTLLRFVGGEEAVGSKSSEQQSSNELVGCPVTRMEQLQPIHEKQCLNINDVKNNEGQQQPWVQYSEYNATAESSINELKFNDFQVVDQTCSTVKIERPQKKIVGNSTNEQNAVSRVRQITPWAIINMPPTSASERLKQLINPVQLHRAMCDLLKKSDSLLNKQDEDGDTPLMCLVSNPQELLKKLSYLVPLVQRLGTIEGALTILNNRGQDSLYLAAMNNPQASYIVGYMAAFLVQKNVNIGQTVYTPRGNTLIHELASKGDSHSLVMAELLSLKNSQGGAVFDLSKYNYDGRTPLHLAAMVNKISIQGLRSPNVNTIKLLMQRGADPSIPDLHHGNTALHMVCSTSCDTATVKALLLDRGRTVVNMVNYDGNTPMHLVMANIYHANDQLQREVCWLLVLAGARTDVRNHQGRTPIELAASGRKESLLSVLYAS